ncbi:sigma-70 family RNA polymerase sigma factor [Candidatus Uhrbacteria bacterium]|jgi:RNA polymerase sigma-70 factor, ECF subfamily|nr:sigma-70 family RNA polymerase sigma factor [Candidatus Uhrbacteria bacterium]
MSEGFVNTRLPNEDMLVEQAKTQDEAFGALYDFYFPKIYKYILRRVGHRQTAEDLISSTFMKAFTKLDTYKKGTGSFQAWLYRIATNNVIDHYRRAGKRQEVDIEPMIHLETNEPGPERHASNAIDRENIEEVLGKLPDKDQEVLQLKFFAEFSNIEIAEALGISVSNSGVRIYRALKKFESIYKEYVKE